MVLILLVNDDFLMDLNRVTKHTNIVVIHINMEISGQNIYILEVTVITYYRL